MQQHGCADSNASDTPIYCTATTLTEANRACPYLLYRQFLMPPPHSQTPAITVLACCPHCQRVRRMLDSAISPAGRQQLAQTFRLCEPARLASKEAVQALLRDVLYTFQGIAQVRVGAGTVLSVLPVSTRVCSCSKTQMQASHFYMCTAALPGHCDP
jgi:hypothetical protein